VNISSSTPYQYSMASQVLASNQTLGDQSIDDPGSVLKPVEEAKDANKPNNAKESYPVNSPDNANITSVDSESIQQEAESKRLQSQQEQIEQQQIQQLSARDREVRNHERAHAAVGGQYAGAPRYQYERGPDGVNYAVSGEVSISAGPVNGDPQATIDKAQVIRRAALAPAEPSAQDRSVAAQATQMESEARVELANLEREERLEEARLREEQAEQARQENLESKESNSATNAGDASTDKEQQQAEQQFAYNRLSNQLSQRLIDSSVEAQAPRPGQIVSRFA
jgi:hypothetical protein